MSLPKSHKLNNGTSIPIIGLGVYLMEQDVTASVVITALNMGYRLIDTAQCYYNEKETCEGIKSFLDSQKGKVSRSEVLYTTKIWDTDHGYEECKASIAKSLAIAQEAGLEYIDILLMHSPFEGKRRETWKAMEEAVAAGHVKTIGVSNFGIRHLEELMSAEDLHIVPAINQMELSPWLQRTEIVDFCRQKGIVLEAYAPLTQGNKLGDEQLLKVADKYGRSPAEILIKWSLQKGFLPIPKSLKKERLQANFNTATNPGELETSFELSQEDLNSLGDPNAYEHFDWDPVNCP